jgi:hypothetical protein
MSWFTSLRNRVEAVVAPTSLTKNLISTGANDLLTNTGIGQAYRGASNVAAVAAGAYVAAPYLISNAGALAKGAGVLLGGNKGGQPSAATPSIQPDYTYNAMDASAIPALSVAPNAGGSASLTNSAGAPSSFLGGLNKNVLIAGGVVLLALLVWKKI